MVRGLVLLLFTSSLAFADNPPLVGATEVAKIAPTGGFIDDAIALDAQRLAYVVADTSSRAELHVLALATKQEQPPIDLSAITLHPIALELVAGNRAFVVGATDDGKQVGALIDISDKATGKGKPIYKLPAASHITVITRDGKQRIAVHNATGTRHEVALYALETGARIGASRTLELDATKTNKALDFHVNHFSDGFTHAYGIKGGEWDKKENQRSPDVEATYDLVTGKFTTKTPITDLFEQRRRFQTLADTNNRGDFLIATTTALQLWRAGKPRPVELDQPFASYDTRSLQGIVLADGSAWVALKIDPVNPDAVARKKADPEYLDIFRVTAEGKATRKARILAASVRHRFGVAGTSNRFWLLERNQGFDRGGKSIAVYDLP